MVDQINARRAPFVPIYADTVDGASWKRFHDLICDSFREGAPVVFADNIDEFAANHLLDGDEYALNPSDVPNLVPPFEMFWLEWKTSVKQNSISGMSRVAALILGQDHGDKLADLKGEPRFVFTVRYFYELPWDSRGIGHPVQTSVFTSNGAGTLVNMFDCDDELLTGVKYTDDDPRNGNGSRRAHPFGMTVLVALSFMNCRNVGLRDGVIPPKLNAAHRRRNGRSLLQYKTIDIWPVSKLMHLTGDVTRESARQALHIVRGHFKTYSGSGLFGKHKGTFFWGQYAAGNLSHGEIKSDYRIPLNGKAPFRATDPERRRR